MGGLEAVKNGHGRFDSIFIAADPDHEEHNLSKAKRILKHYDFPVFPEDFAYYLLKDNNTLIMVSAIKNVNKNLKFNISKKNLQPYDHSCLLYKSDAADE